MRCRFSLALALLAGLACLHGAETPPDDAPIKRADATTVDGYDLFSWFVKGEDAPRFALLPAAKDENLKAAGDVTAKETVITGIDALKRRLSALAIGEKIGWYNMLAKGKAIPDGVNFDFPQRDTIRDIELYCSALKVRLNIFRTGKKQAER